MSSSSPQENEVLEDSGSSFVSRSADDDDDDDDAGSYYDEEEIIEEEYDSQSNEESDGGSFYSGSDPDRGSDTGSNKDEDDDYDDGEHEHHVNYDKNDKDYSHGSHTGSNYEEDEDYDDGEDEHHDDYDTKDKDYSQGSHTDSNYDDDDRHHDDGEDEYHDDNDTNGKDYSQGSHTDSNYDDDDDDDRHHDDGEDDDQSYSKHSGSVSRRESERSGSRSYYSGEGEEGSFSRSGSSLSYRSENSRSFYSRSNASRSFDGSSQQGDDESFISRSREENSNRSNSFVGGDDQQAREDGMRENDKEGNESYRLDTSESDHGDVPADIVPTARNEGSSQCTGSLVSPSSQGQQSGQVSFEEDDRSQHNHPVGEEIVDNSNNFEDESRSSFQSQYSGAKNDGEEDDERSYFSGDDRSYPSQDNSQEDPSASSENEGQDQIEREGSISKSSDEDRDTDASSHNTDKEKNTWWKLDRAPDEGESLFDPMPENKISRKQVFDSNRYIDPSLSEEDIRSQSNQNSYEQDDGLGVEFAATFATDSNTTAQCTSIDVNKEEIDLFDNGGVPVRDPDFGAGFGRSGDKPGNDQDFFADDPFNPSSKGDSNEMFVDTAESAFGGNHVLGQSDGYNDAFDKRNDHVINAFGDSPFESNHNDTVWNADEDVSLSNDEKDKSNDPSADFDNWTNGSNQLKSQTVGEGLELTERPSNICSEEQSSVSESQDESASQKTGDRVDLSEGPSDTNDEEQSSISESQDDSKDFSGDEVDAAFSQSKVSSSFVEHEMGAPLVSDQEDDYEDRPEFDTDLKGDASQGEHLTVEEGPEAVIDPGESYHQQSETPLSGFHSISFSINIPTPVPDINTLIILCSMFPGSAEEAANQDETMVLCKSRGLGPHIVQILGQQKPSQRDELLQISKAQGFPQFFLYWEQTVSYIGDFETLLQIEDDGDLNLDLLRHDFTDSAKPEVDEDSALGGDASKSFVSETQQINISESRHDVALEAQGEGDNDTFKEEKDPNGSEEEMSRSLSDSGDHSRSLDGSRSEESRSRSQESLSSRSSRSYSLESSRSSDSRSFQASRSNTVDTYSGTIDTFSDDESEVPQSTGDRNHLETGHISFRSSSEKNIDDQSTGSGQNASQDRSERSRQYDEGSAEPDNSLGEDHSGGRSGNDTGSYTEHDEHEQSVDSIDQESAYDDESFDDTREESLRSAQSFGQSVDDGTVPTFGESVDDGTVPTFGESVDDGTVPTFGESVDVDNCNEGTERSEIDSLRSQESEIKDRRGGEEPSQSEEDFEGEESVSKSQRSVSISITNKSIGNKSEDQLEQSMMIGEVFGQPNELFEDFKEKNNLSQVGEEEESQIGEEEDEKSSGHSHGESDSVKSARRDVDETPQREVTEEEYGSFSDQLIDDEEPPAETTPDKEKQKAEVKTAAPKRSKSSKKNRKKKRRRRRREAKSPALLDFAANVNEAMLDLEEMSETQVAEIDDSSAYRLLHGFDALLGIFLQLSDELELKTTFLDLKKKKDKDKDDMVHIHALQAVLSFADTFDQLFADLMPIILDCFDEDPDDEMDDLLYRLNSLVDLLCETTDRVGEKQEWNERAETTYVTLLELMERDALDLRCIFQDVDTPDQGLSANIHEAWSQTGHIEELRALQYAEDPWLFRQICYEVMVSTDQWCPDTSILMEICGIDPEMLEEEPDPEYLEEEEPAPIPQAAEHILDKVNGDPLPRPEVMASILRRIMPPRAVTDATLLDHFTSIRNTLQSPLGLSATNIVSISSIAETLEDPDSLGVGGMGKSTLAAMVAVHPDVRRWFIDGVVWIYVGDKELTYSRYTQCLRELVAQLDFYQGVPLFAELLHTPGEPMSKRRRREEGFMIYARDTIAELLHDRSVLIILDDVCFEPDLDWFDFAPMPGESMDEEESTCALLVTTRCRSLLPAADTVEVDMLEEADAISLLIQESGQLSHALMAESKEARSVVRECANHPLAVKSVGRWLNLKHATSGVISSVEEIHAEVIKSMDKILKGGDHTGTDMMYEVLSMSLSPAINGEPTSIIKFCLAAFITVFCDREYISDFALTEPTPIIPMDMAELLFETLLEMNESSLLQKGSLFYAQKKEAAVLIPEALSALGVLKVITYSDAEDDEENPEDEQKFLQVMHFIHHEYGEFLTKEEVALQDLTKDAERQWNRALVEAYLSHVEEWDMDLEDAAHSYALEMIISHMIRGGMYSAAADLLADKSFVRGRLLSLGRENSTRRHIKDCETLFMKLKERKPRGSKLEPRNVMKQAYQALGSQLAIDDDDQSMEDSRIKDVEVARAHYEIGFSLSEKRCWSAAIAHWETSQKLLESALGTVEVVAGIMYNIGVVYSEMNEYEQALDSLKKCLRIRGTIHGEEHILYAQTIQKIGDIFLSMSDYHEAMESYNWALDVMYTEPSHHRVEIGEILDNKGTIHYSKGEIDEALQCHQEALRSKQVDLGEDHPELAATYHHIGNCLSDQGNIDDAIVHFEEAIRLKELDPEGGPERDADVLTIEGILHNLEGNQDQGLECYEKALQLLVTKVPHRKEKVASLLHLIGCVYLMSGEQKKAMKLFEESLQARRKVLGFVHLDVASTLFNMAFLHQTRNRLDRALKCLEEALKIRQLRLPDSEKVAVTHEKIGSLARAIGKTKKAQIAFEEALRIRRLIHGEQNEAVATVLQELGDLMDDLGEYDSAMSYYIDALDIRRNRLGLDDIAVAETLYSMGYTLHNNDEPDRALVCFEESLSIRRYQLGEDSKEVGDTLNMMGFLKAKKGELDDAITLLWDALRIRKLQEDHVKVSETLKNIGNVHREKQEHELAVECYEECLRIRRSELGADHEKVADALIAMGNVLSDMQQTEEAMRSYQEALKIRTLVFGEHDESVAAVLQYMGTMEFRAGNHAKARDLLTEFIRIRRDNGTKNDGDYVNVLFMIGNIHKMEGHEAEARLCWTEAYQVFQELGLAETNPQIAKVMNHLLKVENLEEQDSDQKGKSVFAKVTEKFKKGGESQKGRRRKKGKAGVALD